MPRLPLDILINILEKLPPSRDADRDNSVNTIINCSTADSLFREATNVSSLWQPHYEVRYLHSNQTEEARRQAENNGNWKSMYAARRLIDKEALAHLDAIVLKRAGRYDHARAVTRVLFDAWDVLEIETAMVDCSEHMKVLEHGQIPSLSATRGYWASALLASIGRMHTVEIWTSIRLGNPLPFVEAFSSISCFFGRHPDEMSSILADLNDRCRTYLIRSKFPLDQDHPKYDIKKLCVLICEFMTCEGYGPVASGSFHQLRNLLPHLYLTMYKQTIPLSLVHIFVSIARSLGITASPVDFPVRVLAHISDPAPDKDGFYVDVYGSSTQAILSLREDIPALLARQGIGPASIEEFIAPCGANSMILRNTRNILASLRTDSPPLHQPSALLAFTIYSLLPLNNDAYKRVAEQVLLQAECLDCATFLSQTLIPCLALVGAAEMQKLLSEGCQKALEDEDTVAKAIKLRSSKDMPVQYFVGMLFEHKKYQYTGLIIGWDPVCNASERWIKEMGVLTLPRGKDQPFYSVLCQDSSSRYVAEENIQPMLAPSREILTRFCRNVRVLPMFFTGILRKRKEDTSSPLDNGASSTNTLPTVDEIANGVHSEDGPARARFSFSPELTEAYPEDGAIGDAWLVG